MVRDVGEVSQEGGTTIRWTLPRFMQMPREADTELRSPDFTFRGEVCQLWGLPNGWKQLKTEGWMGMGCLIPSLPQHSCVTICMTDRGGREILHTETVKDGPHYTQYKWIRRSEFEARREEILQGGALRIVIKVVLPEEGDRRREEEKNPGSGAMINVTNLGNSSNSGTNTQNNESERTRELRNFSENSFSQCSRLINEGFHELIENLKDLYIHGKNSDLIIKVRGREFPVHRLILQARIPAFDAMLSHDTAEKREGIVNMEDSDPDVFHEFLLFVYSGTLKNISPDNMCGLYVLSDKYDLQKLKQMCLNYIRTSLSVKSICDVISLAIRHDESELLKIATDFFVQNSEEILLSVKWQVFIKENPEIGNELFLKTVKFFKTKLSSK